MKSRIYKQYDIAIGDSAFQKMLIYTRPTGHYLISILHRKRLFVRVELSLFQPGVRKAHGKVLVNNAFLAAMQEALELAASQLGSECNVLIVTYPMQTFPFLTRKP